MSATITITAGKTFANNETVDNSKLNLLGLPTATLTAGSIAETDLNSAVGTKLNAIGSFVTANVSESTNFTVNAPADKGKMFDVTTAGSNITATLPSAATAGQGFQLWLHKVDSGGGLILTSPTTSPNAIAIGAQGQYVLIVSDGTNWNVPITGFISQDVNGRLYTLSSFFVLGGDDATVPAAKRNGTTWQFRLGDDSADASITAAGGTFSGVVSNNGWFALGNLAAGSPVIDASKGNRQWGTLTGNLTNVSITNMTEGQPLVVALVQDGTGSRTVTWTGITWGAGGSAPTQTATIAKRDFYSFERLSAVTYGIQQANF